MMCQLSLVVPGSPNPSPWTQLPRSQAPGCRQVAHVKPWDKRFILEEALGGSAKAALGNSRKHSFLSACYNQDGVFTLCVVRAMFLSLKWCFLVSWSLENHTMGWVRKDPKAHPAWP